MEKSTAGGEVVKFNKVVRELLSKSVLETGESVSYAERGRETVPSRVQSTDKGPDAEDVLVQLEKYAQCSEIIGLSE